MNYSRYIPATGFASAATFSLFFIMQSLVANNTNAEIITHFRPAPQIPIEKLTPPIVKSVDRLKSYEPVDIPETPDTVLPTDIPGPTDIIIPGTPPPVKVNNPSQGLSPLSDGAMVPIVRVEPQFPRRAAERGITGWTVIEFTVTAAGTIENAVIIDAEPKGYFETASLKAVKKFRYKPQVVNGVSIDTPNVFTRFNFQLDE